MKTQTNYLGLKIDDETKEKLKILAAMDNRTVSGYLKNFIRQEYDKKCLNKIEQ